ncbi:MAG: glycosyltransferase [Candidatus Omnitrophica bacterium]|nr:glycosyltransferase [Candidatus Omnitrophota bacterium]
MKIGIDVREMRKDRYTGLRRVLEGFLSCAEAYSQHDFTLFADSGTDLDALPRYARTVVFDGVNPLVYDQVLLPSAIKKNGIEVFYSPYVKTPFLRSCRYVNTVSDLIPLYFPKYGGIRGAVERMSFFVTAYIFTRRATSSICISEDATEKAGRFAGGDPGKLKTVYPAVPGGDAVGGGQTGRKIYNDKFILYAGNFKPHKNVETLVRAYALIDKSIRAGCRLMLIGGEDTAVKRVKALAVSLGVEDRVKFRGKVDDAELSEAYRKAECFVFPSFMEGFGLPPLEAMMRGTAVAASNKPPLDEVLGDAALYFDPGDARNMAEVISKLVADHELRNILASRGRRRASLYTRERMSEEMLDVLTDAGRATTLCISTDYPPIEGGISTYIYNLWDRFPARKKIVLTSSGGDSGQPVDTDPEVMRKKYPLGSDLVSRLLRTLALICHAGYVVHIRRVKRIHCAQVLSAGLAGLFMKLRRGITYVVYAYSADILEFSRNFATRAIMKMVFGLSDEIIVCSRFAKALVVGRGLAGKDRVCVITPGVDTDRFSPDKGPGDAREKYSIPKEARVILSVSRLAARKGHRRIIASLGPVFERIPEAVYVVAGDGEEKNVLVEEARIAGIGEKVIFTGSVPGEDLPGLYNACEIFILLPEYMPDSGDIEGFGIVFLEANACGKPVIAADTGGVSEAVIDGETGILVDPADKRAVSAALIKLMEDKRLAGELGEKGLSRVRSDFSWRSRVSALWQATEHGDAEPPDGEGHE